MIWLIIIAAPFIVWKLFIGFHMFCFERLLEEEARQKREGE